MTSGYVYRGTDRLDDPATTTCHGARGTVKGYGRHVRRGERPCDRCRDAMNAYNRERRRKWENNPTTKSRDRERRRARARAWAALARQFPAEYQVLLRRELARAFDEGGVVGPRRPAPHASTTGTWSAPAPTPTPPGTSTSPAPAATSPTSTTPRTETTGEPRAPRPLLPHPHRHHHGDREVARPERPTLMLTINVTGLPAPQGSKRAFVVNGRPVMAESSKKVKPWRQDVVAAVAATLREHAWEVPTGPVRVDITYYLPRPKYHFRTGKNAHLLRDNAPSYVDKKPDRDKLDRATCDALTTSGVIRDDAQIADGQTTKRYADAATGARITITPLTDPVPAVVEKGKLAAAGAAPTPEQGVLL